MPNPFSPQHPAQPEYFVGRKEEVEYFRATALNSAQLKPPSPMNYAILGTWGLGKTSLLYELKQIALQDLKKDIKSACIHCPLTPQAGRSWQTFSADFLNNVNSTINATTKVQSKIVSELTKWQPAFNLGIVSAQRSGASRTTSPDMLTSLKDLWNKHLRPSGIDVVFILLDDFHYFPIAAEDSSYLTLRAIFQELVNQKCNYSLIVTAHSGLFTELADMAEPLLRFFKRFELKPFVYEEAREAIDKRLNVAGVRLKVSDDTVSLILEKTGGHPYLLMYTMFELLIILKGADKIAAQSFQKVWPRIEESLGDNIFSQKFEVASAKEKEILIEMGRLEGTELSPSDLKNFKGATEMLSRLERKEFLVKRGRGKYTLFHPLFRDYLKRRAAQ
ncbi:MAG: hypothetical protein PXY39_01150 [archaeon]|nr:hypothetical protein [archaeon]